jgi:hypothetical protein
VAAPDAGLVLIGTRLRLCRTGQHRQNRNREQCCSQHLGLSHSLISLIEWEFIDGSQTTKQPGAGRVRTLLACISPAFGGISAKAFGPLFAALAGAAGDAGLINHVGR